MQLTWLTVFSEPAVVIDPVRCIGVLLYLRNQHALTDSVQRPGRYKKHIAPADLHFVYDLHNSVVFDRLFKVLLVGIIFKADNYA